ncbi:MAG TPA: fluoride efflux transporter CrcB [Bryobacteraceae bacterium]|nr:fluoride efflux transporter CrcB [Bryobacteraceae bacterium]
MAGHQALAFLLIFLGGGIGSVLRYGVNLSSASLFGPSFPWGTLLVNILGSVAMGLLAGWLAFRLEGGQLFRQFLATGVLGGFTTFSAFSLDVALLWQSGQTAAAVLYALGSVAAAILGVFAGLAITRVVLP